MQCLGFSHPNCLPSSAFGIYWCVSWNNCQASQGDGPCVGPQHKDSRRTLQWEWLWNQRLLINENDSGHSLQALEETQSVGNTNNNDVGENTIWKENYFFFNFKGNEKSMVLRKKQTQACVYFHWTTAPEVTLLIRFFVCDFVIRSLLMSLHHYILSADSLGCSGGLQMRKQRETSA